MSLSITQPEFKIQLDSASKIEVIDNSRFDPRSYGAIADGKAHPLSEMFNDTKRCQGVYPHVTHLGQTIDWAALQKASDAARDCVRNTLASGNVEALFRTLCSRAPLFYISPGDYIVNWPVTIYPHVSVRGTDQGHSRIKLDSTTAFGWTTGAPVLPVNPQGVMWLGKRLTDNRASAVMWMQGDEEWPIASKLKVAGMVCSVSNVGLFCHNGACFYSAGNQNQFDFCDNWLNGYGDGPMGACGFLSNNTTSSTQISNFKFRGNTVEGLNTGIITDKLAIGTISGENQFDNVANAIYVGHLMCGGVDHNTISYLIGGTPGKNGIWVGLGEVCSIESNKIMDIEPGAGVSDIRPASVIRVLGRSVNVANNIISVRNNKNTIKTHGWAIHLCTPRNQFGGDTALLQGRYGPIVVTGNNIDCDVWPKTALLPGSPPPTAFDAIWRDDYPGERLLASIYNNCDRPLIV